MEYKILSDFDLDFLVEAVNKLLSEGWKCQGGLCITPETESKYGTYHQAMIKE